MTLKHINDIVSVCAGHGVETAIISPGSRSAPITLAFNAHTSIDVKVIADERSAAFIATGIAQQQKKPVVLVCTSGSAVLNYVPAIAEAYYQEIPVIVISADRPPEWVNQYDGQTIQQSGILGKHILASYDYPIDDGHADTHWHGNRIVNEALIKAMSFPQGPVHINVPLREPFYPSEAKQIKFDKARIIKYTAPDTRLIPSLINELESEWSQYESMAIVIGQHDQDDELSSAIEEFCKRTGTVVINDVIGNQHLIPNAIQHHDAFLQPKIQNTLLELKPDLVISIGKSLISKNLKVFFRENPPKAHWHISQSDRINDIFKQLTRSIYLEPKHFFNSFKPASGDASFGKKWTEIEAKAKSVTSEYLMKCPFGEFKAITNCIEALPENSQLHLANSMAVRYANFIGLNKKLEVFSNRGTSGIDGSNGTAVGAALSQNKMVTLITGDMAFFYDRNAFWHPYEPSKLRVVILNNHGGGIFRMIKGPQDQPDYDKLFETDQPLTAENTARDYNFEYLSCTDLGGLTNALKGFYQPSEGPKVIEVFSDSKQNTEIFEAFKKAIIA
ncbi:2-succinyl-5-enolpyruvyl-6-hydroxy-3-cyclohexene-1-carboxylic-acid synthase [Roseivirga sp. E12]|uniref:2-succinyl-5-enolpyruvyl-6-hydroxy-3- cyclohexene-1-carboxylic-acid synthase n=1 Tax=Roseivirga sp. E12 TaxID=2819237 RepID=UPI001ABD2537|nr:2-succinyl-5-enolpyruvyl-6-hydroxy-3-cyclohexene-1-carboxylic-acid synthase [Roseivirga sp. E12]MBO3700494.1 2-succinyl-5-enolpyruvyl-6-hydroxy-3-cyclohexene-1-carboxylic-acid synthase [Roseivirga sp. E12]